jgi:tryptophanyl-tRNA synthetase
MGELGRMTQYKDKAGIVETQRSLAAIAYAIQKGEYHSIEELKNEVALKDFLNDQNRERTSVGLFDYPVLMAADILLYDTVVVPVGEDQKQHVELTRDLAMRFNSRFGDTFVVPEPLIEREGARIMGLDDPTKKMSKSAASEYNSIALSDDADTIRRKVKKAVTDSGSEIVYRDDKPALKNLINIYTLLSGKSVDEVEALYQGKGYGDFKADLAEVIVGFLGPFQERINALSDEEVLAVLRAGAEKAHALSEKKMREVYEKVGFVW